MARPRSEPGASVVDGESAIAHVRRLNVPFFLACGVGIATITAPWVVGVVQLVGWLLRAL